MSFEARSCSNCDWTGTVEVDGTRYGHSSRNEVFVIEYWRCPSCECGNETHENVIMGPDPDDQRDLLRERREDAR